MKYFTHRLSGRIDQKAFDGFMETIERVRSQGSKKDTFILYVYSKGGELYWADRISRELILLLHDGFNTLGIAYKEVHSAALIPYLSCAYRISRSKPTFLFHKPLGKSGEFLGEDQRKFFEFVSKRTYLGSHYLTRLVEANKGRGTYLKERRAKLFRIINFEYKTKGVAQIA